jgi:ribosomal protein S18 acetylase RimI-like enzyme
MVAEDKAAIMEILHNTPEFNDLDRLVAEEVIDAYIFNPSGNEYHALVAEVDGRVAGYVCYGHNSMTVSTWDIYWIAVAHDCQGLGIGRELMAATEHKIKIAGGNLIVLETSSTPLYDRTNRFYIKQNYTQASRITDFYGPGDDQILYIKRFH